jgi:hypothetical protein
MLGSTKGRHGKTLVIGLDLIRRLSFHHQDDMAVEIDMESWSLFVRVHDKHPELRPSILRAEEAEASAPGDVVLIQAVKNVSGPLRSPHPLNMRELFLIYTKVHSPPFLLTHARRLI